MINTVRVRYYGQHCVSEVLWSTLASVMKVNLQGTCIVSLLHISHLHDSQTHLHLHHTLKRALYGLWSTHYVSDPNGRDVLTAKPLLITAS